jgi:hypothetical protein
MAEKRRIHHTRKRGKGRIVEIFPRSPYLFKLNEERRMIWMWIKKRGVGLTDWELRISK